MILAIVAMNEASMYKLIQVYVRISASEALLNK